MANVEGNGDGEGYIMSERVKWGGYDHI